METVVAELGIPRKYLKKCDKEDRFVALVHKQWLKSLVKHHKLGEFLEMSRGLEGEEWSPKATGSWSTVFLTVLRKMDAKVIPLPRIRPGQRNDGTLLFSQLMQYVAQTNFRNSWKEAFRKYTMGGSGGGASREAHVSLADYNEVLKETVTRIYGCSIVNTCNPELTIGPSRLFDVHLNVLPAVVGVETLNAIFLVHLPYLGHNLSDCVTFSPAILEKNFSKPLFIVYQLLQTLRALHDRSLTLGDISLKDIYLTEDMWLYVFPQITSNVYVKQPESEGLLKYDCRKSGHRFEQYKCIVCGTRIYDKVPLNQANDLNLNRLCQLWIDGQISNFSYISALNRLSGRKLNDPNCHHVFPWVTDFSQRCGKVWRDLKKSKYRLNKGDRQLDLTYDTSQTQVPHHVSDVLSSITYYVYMARRTPKPVLCKNVRTIWVPAEYPTSIQRMQEWTPDECIPEFFTDPTVFRSLHDDLEDLEVPPWASGPEDFIDKHREALESQHVSERLHFWIDLTFGYKLSGNAAIKAKNVCLHLADDHAHLTKSGIVQLFTQPHPARATHATPFWGKAPPKIPLATPLKRPRDRSTSSTTKSDEDDPSAPTNRSPLSLTKNLSRSRSSLNEEQASRSPSNQRSTSLGPKNASFTSHVLINPTCLIVLPKEFRPEAALEALEKRHAFISKTFHPEVAKQLPNLVEDTPKVHSEFTMQNAFTNFVFAENFERCRKSASFPPDVQQKKLEQNQVICNYLEIISGKRVKELQVLGCLVVEIFAAKQLRAAGGNRTLSFPERMRLCRTVMASCHDDLPSCVVYLVGLLLGEGSSCVSDRGLPPPSAHLLLEPLNSIIPFPKLFPELYRLVLSLKDFRNVAIELSVLYHFDCNGELCAEYENLERTKVLFAQNIGECRVKLCAKQLDELLEEFNNNTDLEVIKLLVPHVKELIEDPPTSVLACWYLFDTISRVLGPQITTSALLDSILKLYDNEPSDSNLPYNAKIAKLYHHSFLLRLIVRLGLKTFLDYFVTPLVEAVGGYKDYDVQSTFFHTHQDKTNRRNHLKTMDHEVVDLSTSDDSSGSSERTTSKPTPPILAPPEEVFEFDEEPDNQMKSLIEHLELNVASDLPFNHSTAEEALDATLTESVEQLRHLEELSLDELKVTSPVIAIPPPSYKLRHEISQITCDVGSKKSDEVSDEGSAPRRVRRDDVKISDMSADSLVWLSHRLGPVLTARHLSRNLLKMLTLCYVGAENLTSELSLKCDLSIAQGRVVGDQSAMKVLECLASIAGLYGEALILFQYIPHMSELIALCKRKLTANLEGALISCLALLKHIIPYLSDAALMDQLQDVILKNILHPVVRLLGSVKHTYPSGACARSALARKYLDTLYVLSIRMGSDMTKSQLAVPALQRFFLIFNKVHGGAEQAPPLEPTIRPFEDSLYVEVGRDGTTTEWSVGGRPLQITRLHDDSLDNSPQMGGELSDVNVTSSALAEIRLVFTAELAHTAYVPFLKHVGVESLGISLNNHDLIKELCREHERQVGGADHKIPAVPISIQPSNSIGSNISVIGNRLDVQAEPAPDLLSLVSNRIENTSRHLRGNWLAYWEHEIGRADKDVMFNFKQIKLQTFQGHTHSVKALSVLDNENSFMSGSRDKTVKLWSLRSQGDGAASCCCQWTYSAHKKSILSLCFVESLRLVASCDSVVHIWDPFLGANVGHLESSRYSPVNCLKSMPAPSSLVFAATTEGLVKVIDARLCSYVYELKISVNPSGLIRCLAIAPSGNWLACGQSSGCITILDTRTGLVIASWRAHENEVLQVVPVDDSTIVSSSLDQSVNVWNIHDGKLKFFMRGATEPVHCLNVYNHELISGTTANRIGVHTSIDVDSCFSSTKLRSDTFRGLLTSMAILPLNRLLLLGADSGNISLLC